MIKLDLVVFFKFEHMSLVQNSHFTIVVELQLLKDNCINKHQNPTPVNGVILQNCSAAKEVNLGNIIQAASESLS